MTAGSTEPYAGTTDANGNEYWAKIPSSIILGTIGEGLSSEARAYAFHLYCFLDLEYNTRTWPVVGYRDISRKLGWDERTVSRYVKTLADAGLVEVEQEGRQAARIRLAHNPARRRINPKAQVGPPPELYCHQRKGYKGDPEPSTPGEPHNVQYDSHEMQFADGSPTAHDAPGSISPMCGFLRTDTVTALLELVDETEDRCGCGFLLTQELTRNAVAAEFCQGPF